jgi:hypothetical protein
VAKAGLAQLTGFVLGKASNRWPSGPPEKAGAPAIPLLQGQGGLGYGWLNTLRVVVLGAVDPPVDRESLQP